MTEEMGVSTGRRVLLVALGAIVAGAVAALPAKATAPAANGKIVYGQVFPNYGVTINADGSDAHAIGPLDSTTCDTISPDGRTVLCNLWRTDSVQPATANLDGSQFTLLNQQLPFDLFCLTWSPDGARLLCHSEGIANPADAGLYTARSSDAGDLVRVSTTLPGGFDIGYGYSPDGSRILYARFDAGIATLFSVEPDGSDPIQLSPPGLSVIDLGYFDRVGADWSPGGAQVTFAAHDTAGPRFNSGLFVVNADGSGLRRISPPGVGALSAQWSPDGASIAFTGGCCGISGAWVVRPDGTGLRAISTPIAAGRFRTPVWSPDSSKLLLNRLDSAGNASLWVAEADGSSLRKLADTASPSLYAWGTAPAQG
jgi:Tol biopolymer transport system component